MKKLSFSQFLEILIFNKKIFREFDDPDVLFDNMESHFDSLKDYQGYDPDQMIKIITCLKTFH